MVKMEFDPAHAAAGSTYLIFFTARSGSSWLASRLRSTGLMGDPDEWLNPDFWELNRTRFKARSASEYILSLRSERCTSNGVFGCQLSGGQLKIWGSSVLDYLRPISRSFCLFRRDIVAQAVSLYSAVTTQRFHIQRDEEMQPTIPPFSGDAISGWLRHLLHEEIWLAGLFSKRELLPQCLWYEDLVNRMDDVISSMCQQVLGDSSPNVIPAAEDEYRKIAGPDHAELTERFRSDYSLIVQHAENLRQEFIYPTLSFV
jgi:trehalose 2-sulfotransferase